MHSPKLLPSPDSAAAVLLFILGILVLCEVENQFFALVLGFREHSFSASGLSSQLWHLLSYDFCSTREADTTLSTAASIPRLFMPRAFLQADFLLPSTSSDFFHSVGHSY